MHPHDKHASNADPVGDFDDLALPSLGAEADEGEGLDDEEALEGIGLAQAPSLGDDPFEDGYADDLPLDIEIAVADGEPSALGDDAKGLDDDHDAVAVDEGGESFVDRGGSAEEGLEFGGNDELGLDPIPTEEDDGGLEGLEDPGAHMVDDDVFPPLGGESDDDDETIDVGIELELDAD